MGNSDELPMRQKALRAGCTRRTEEGSKAAVRRRSKILKLTEGGEGHEELKSAWDFFVSWEIPMRQKALRAGCTRRTEESSKAAVRRRSKVLKLTEEEKGTGGVGVRLGLC